jgi:CheY-like chemotaxis protein
MTPARILIVDDEPEIVRLLARRLTRRGYHVTQALGGEEALARVQETVFDLAILDYMMPGTDGLQLAQECLKRQPALQILILTGSPVITEIEAARFACLRKPLENLEHLDEAVDRLIAAGQKDLAAGGEP